MHVDASDSAIGLVLSQTNDSNHEYVIAYGGRNLSTAEQKYSAKEREALAVVHGIRAFRPYLYGRHFTVHTDHNALRWLMNIKDPEGRLARVVLSIYNSTTLLSFIVQERATATPLLSLGETTHHY